jgi:hypothetical protein
MVIDFNRACISTAPINTAINDLIEAAVMSEANTRQYLGASSIGSECHRRIQYDWMVDGVHSQRMLDIFHRGDVFEARSREVLTGIGFRFAPDATLGFEALGGLFRGHADGIIDAGPSLPGFFRASGSTSVSARADGKRSSVTGLRKLGRNTPRRSGSIKRTSTIQTPRSSPSPMPTHANACT